jgi:hypothetical protein
VCARYLIEVDRKRCRTEKVATEKATSVEQTKRNQGKMFENELNIVIRFPALPSHEYIVERAKIRDKRNELV